MKKISILIKVNTLLWIYLILISSMNAYSQTLYVPGGISGIGSSSTSNVGIGVSNPASMLSVGTAGANYVTGFFVNSTSVNSNCYAIYSAATINSGTYTKGIYATSYSTTPLSTARAYGVQGLAGNATSGWNYGVYGLLAGSNNGAAIYGSIPGQPNGYDEDTQGQYAGYFKGAVYMSTQLSVGYKTAAYTLDVNGYIRGYNLTPSDGRLKENIKKLSGSLALLKNLNGVSYQLRPDGIEALSKNSLVNATGTIDTGKTVSIKSHTVNSELLRRKHIGFVAQDVQKVFPELVHTDTDGVLSVDYVSLIPVLVESIKELNNNTSNLQTINNKLEDALESSATEIQILKKKLAELESRLDQCCSSSTNKSNGISGGISGSQTDAVLYQNTPNPFSKNTTIAYYLPEAVLKASLHIYSMHGNPVKVITAVERGNSKVTINSGELKAGLYFYTLIADDKEVDTKRMILTD